MDERTRFMLDEDKIPRAWYNITADLPVPQAPPLHPATHQPLGPADLAPLFPMAYDHAGSLHRARDRDPRAGSRGLSPLPPEPLVRARRLERRSTLAAHIYFQIRGLSPAGSHKPNTAIARPSTTRKRHQAHCDRRQAQGSGVALPRCRRRDVRLEINGLHVRGHATTRSRTAASWMETYGASVVASPSMEHGIRTRHPGAAPRQPRLAWHGHQRGRRGHDERDDTTYSLGSVLNHVMLNQTSSAGVDLQMEMAGEEPDVIIAAPAAAPTSPGSRSRGSSNIPRRPANTKSSRRPEAAPSLTRGK